MTRFWYELRESSRPARAARLIAQGVSKHVLEGPRYTQTAWGFHRPTGCVATPTQRIVDVAARLPAGGVIGGWAAAYVQGVDRLDGFDDHTMDPQPIPVLLPPGLHRQPSAGVRYVQVRATVPSQLVAQIPVTGVVRTGLDLARWAPDVTEAVAALDAMLAARVVTRARLVTGLPRQGRARGIPQARRAVDLCRAGVRSTWESRLRVWCVLELGFTGLQVNQAVFDRMGRLLGVPDLLDDEAGLAIEYDGARWGSSAGHRDRDQHREDNVREERLERAGLIVVRADKSDLTRYRSRLGERLTAARLEGVRRDRTRDGWTLSEPEGWFGLPA